MIIAWSLVFGCLIGICVFVKMMWTNWKSGDEASRVEPSTADVDLVDVPFGDTDSGPMAQHHDHVSHQAGRVDFGSDHGLGHFDGGHHY